ncbi:Sad1_UNC superfamily domain-containing protein [Histoplasma capsulatum G186AR]|uniref:Sad1_UNC superfamily domain-containing protein n=1 Tax=Ajellomyces capsulatus TaxID=5037 RepID=A0A8H7ZCY9_AJECA|nr:Sad1_UNC superfamily domain-containing protein [Histoplasma capsulatum]QSS76420.1 Sad1_UNC superfamily domain-containing protein [Histoplasma capsulatum G186AR]
MIPRHLTAPQVSAGPLSVLSMVSCHEKPMPELAQTTTFTIHTVPDLPALRNPAALDYLRLAALYLKRHSVRTLLFQVLSTFQTFRHLQPLEGRSHLFQHSTSYVTSLLRNHPLLLRLLPQSTPRAPPHTPLPSSSPLPLLGSMSPPSNVSQESRKLQVPCSSLSVLSS